MEISSKVIQKLIEFSEARSWEQFHTPENLVKSISIEASELLECFQWSEDFDKDDVRNELADVMSYCLLLAHTLEIDLSSAIIDKLKINEERYPIEKSIGVSTKYDKL